MIDHMLFDKHKWFNIPQNAQSVNVDSNVYRKYPFKTITKTPPMDKGSFTISTNWSEFDMNRNTTFTFDNGDTASINNYLLYAIANNAGSYASAIDTKKGYRIGFDLNFGKIEGNYYDESSEQVGAKWVNIQINAD